MLYNNHFPAAATLLLLSLVSVGQLAVKSQPVKEETTNSVELRAAGEDSCKSLDGFEELSRQIRSKAADVDKIIKLVLNGTERHSTYNELAMFCDTFGPRLSGSKSLERAIDYMSKKMANEAKLKSRAERAMIPKWEVGEQWAELLVDHLGDQQNSPLIKHRMTVLALGGSVSTNKTTLEAELVLVHSFDELRQYGEQLKLQDKIVVFNYKFTSYPESVKFRTSGALEAAKYGASAALIRSVGPFSIYSPHAGMGSRSIPTAAITIEDADLIQRWSNRQTKSIRLRLYLDTRSYDDVESYNLVGDIVGTERPDEVVLVSGHMDSWYNTQGAMDDGGGMMISYKALDVLNKLNLKAKRTMRAVLWTSEEFGLVGAQQYFNSHKHELSNFKAVIESDEGTFKPLGLSFRNVGPMGQCALKELLKLTSSLETNQLNDHFEGSDIELFTNEGVPGLSLLNENSKYFYFHHTSGDSMTVEDPDELDKSTALFAATTYVLANLDIDLTK